MSTEQQPAFCRSCGEPIVWLKHQRTGKPAPVERDARPGGNIACDLLTGEYEIIPKAAREPYERLLHFNHFARCLNARGHAKTVTPAATTAGKSRR